MLLPTMKAVAPKFGITLTIADVHDAADIERAIEASAREPNVGLMPLPSASHGASRPDHHAGARHRLPCLYSEAVFPKAAA